MGEKDIKFEDELKEENIRRQLEKLDKKLRRKFNDTLRLKQINKDK